MSYIALPSFLMHSLARSADRRRQPDHLPYQILKTERLTLTEGERGRARSREIIFPSKLRLRRLDGKSERASGADLGGADGWTRKPRSALLRSGMRQRRRWTNAIAATYRSGGRAIAEGYGKKGKRLFFRLCEKWSRRRAGEREERAALVSRRETV